MGCITVDLYIAKYINYVSIAHLYGLRHQILAHFIIQSPKIQSILNISSKSSESCMCGMILTIARNKTHHSDTQWNRCQMLRHTIIKNKCDNYHIIQRSGDEMAHPVFVALTTIPPKLWHSIKATLTGQSNEITT